MYLVGLDMGLWDYGSRSSVSVSDGFVYAGGCYKYFCDESNFYSLGVLWKLNASDVGLGGYVNFCGTRTGLAAIIFLNFFVTALQFFSKL